MLPIITGLIVALFFSVVPLTTIGSHRSRTRRHRHRRAAVAAATTAPVVDRAVMMALRPPELQIPQAIYAVVGQTSSFQVVARGSQGDSIELRAAAINNGAFTIDGNERVGVGRFSFTPDETQVGTCYVIFTVKDQFGLANSRATKIIVSSATAATQQIPTTPQINVGSATVAAPVQSGTVAFAVPTLVLPTLAAANRPAPPTPTVSHPATAADVVASGSRGLVTLDVKEGEADSALAAKRIAAPPDSSSVKANKASASVAESSDSSPVSTSKAKQVVARAETASTATDAVAASAASPSPAAPLREMILTPMAGETLVGGQSVMLTWFAPEVDQVAEQEVRLSTDGGQNFDIVVDPHIATGVQFFNWTVPSDVDTQNARIRVVMRDAYGKETTTDSSDFAIKTNNDGEVISLLNLNGNETLVGGRQFIIRWKTNGVFQPLGYDSTLLIGSETFFPINTDIGSDELQVKWIVPNNINTQHARIQLTAFNIAGQSIPIMSQSEFRIVPEPSIGVATISSGASGEKLEVQGTGFIPKDSVLDINGEKVIPTYGLKNKEGLTDKLTVENGDLTRLLPSGSISTITVINRASGVRSTPYLFERTTTE